jgi:hypothetical protein
MQHIPDGTFLTMHHNCKSVQGRLLSLHPPWHSHIGCSLFRLIRLLSTWCRAAAFLSSNEHSVHCADLSYFSVCGAPRRHFSRQVAQLFRRKFRR